MWARRGPTRSVRRVWWALSASSRVPLCTRRCSLTSRSCWALGGATGGGGASGPEPTLGGGARAGGSSELWAPRGAQGTLSLGLGPASAADSSTGCEPRLGHLAVGSRGFVRNPCPLKRPLGWSERHR